MLAHSSVPKNNLLIPIDSNYIFLHGGFMFISAPKSIQSLLGCALLSMLIFIQGCPIVVIAMYAAYSDDGIVVSVEIPRSAPDIFAAAKKRTEKGVSETGIPYKVTHIDEDNYTIIIEGEDGSWRGSFAIIPIGASKSQILAQGSDDNREKNESERLVLMGVENICKDLGVKYTVVENRSND